MSFRALITILPMWLYAGAVLAAPAGKPTWHDCTFLGHYGQIVMVSYCPAGTPPTEIASFVEVTKDPWIAKYGFVQYRIFSTKDGVPMSMADNMAKSDAWFAKFEIGTALYNKATGHKKLWCKKTVKSELTECTNLLK